MSIPTSHLPLVLTGTHSFTIFFICISSVVVALLFHPRGSRLEPCSLVLVSSAEGRLLLRTFLRNPDLVSLIFFYYLPSLCFLNFRTNLHCFLRSAAFSLVDFLFQCLKVED